MGGDETSGRRRRRHRGSRSPSPSSSLSQDEEERSRKRRKRDDREGKIRKDKSSGKERKKDKERDKSHKHSKSRRDGKKEKKSKEKHKRSMKDLDSPKFEVLSKDDYFAKNNEFATWLKEERGIYFSDLSSDASREMFSTFVKEWNSRKLQPKYYEGITTGPRTAHNWRIEHK